MADPNRFHGECDPCAAGQMEDHSIVDSIDITGVGLKTTGAISFTKSFVSEPAVSAIVEVDHASDTTLEFDSLMVTDLSTGGCTITFKVTVAATTATVAKVHWKAVGT